MKSLVVMTYYQLMHAMALALTFEEKPNLFFCMEFLNPDESLLDRIRETGVFSNVKGITHRGEFIELVKELRKTKKMTGADIDRLGNSLFEKYLEPVYVRDMALADPEEEIYVYNDFQWHYYYINKHFKHVVGVEDGYASLQQQIGIHKYKGDRERLEPFIERGYFPKPLYREDNISKIISSCDFAGIDSYYRSKLVVWDYKDIVAENEQAFKRAVLQVFQLADVNIDSGSVLYVGQPLDRSKYCTAQQNYLLCKKIMREQMEGGRKVYFKPHPADRNDTVVYGARDVVLMPKAFPVEVLNYQDGVFDRLVTFGSTASFTLTCAAETEKYFDKEEFSRKEVADFIEDFIEDERIVIEVFVKARDLTPDTYVNAYSCVIRDRWFRTNVHVVLGDSVDLPACQEFFSPSNAGKMAEAYKKTHGSDKDAETWREGLSWLHHHIDSFDFSVDCMVTASWDEWDVYRQYAPRRGSCDYVLFLDSGNLAFGLMDEVLNSLRSRMYPLLMFGLHACVESTRKYPQKISLNSGYLDGWYKGSLTNRLVHRELLEAAEGGVPTPREFGRALAKHDGETKKTMVLSLRVDETAFTDVEDAAERCRLRIGQICVETDDGVSDIVPQVASIVYDYQNWCAVKESDPLALSLGEAVDQLVEDDVLKGRVFRVLADTVLWEKAKVEKVNVVQDRNFYHGMREVIETASRYGALNVVNKLKQAKMTVKTTVAHARSKGV